ncbi:B-cell receptor CD22-like isoform X1, partial [Clarias magur]
EVMMASLKVTLLFLLMCSGVVSQTWSVHYIPDSICALKRSTVMTGCNYTYPDDYTIQRVFWSRELVTDKEPPDLSLDPKYRDRVQYLGDTQSDCSLRLSNVTEQDQGKYYFRFITTTATGKYQGRDGIKLSVTELQVEMIPDSVVEGDNVSLTCKTTCSLTVTPTFTWYKHEHLSSFISSSNPLHLRSVRQSDAGSYSCAIQGESYRSGAGKLDVQYPPKTVSVSISPSGRIVEGSSVTLTCSSDANPPVQLYTWYNVNEISPVGSGQSYSFTLSSSSSGWFYCVAQNKYGTQRAAAVFLTLNGDRSVVLYVVLGVTGGCGWLFAIIAVLYMRRKKRRGSDDVAKFGQTVHLSPPDNTYTGLDLQTRSSSDVYHTLTSPPDDMYTSLDPQSISPDYDTLT